MAGNVIDLGVNGGLREADVRRALSQVLSELFVGDLESFRAAVPVAQTILCLADNTGEIVLDRLLIERLPPGWVTITVRGVPVLNDATLADVRIAGLDRVAEVADNGSDVPGTILDDCSPAFRERFDQADVIIVQGQGNFETLCDVRANIFFLLKVKCCTLAAHAGLPVGVQALIRGGRR
jgi:hypothetical protein